MRSMTRTLPRTPLLVALIVLSVSSVSSTTWGRVSVPRSPLSFQFVTQEAVNQQRTKISKSALLNKLRGGALDLSDDEDDDDEDEDDDLNLDLDDFEVAEADFAEANTLDRVLEAWKRTPPLTKAYLTASFGATMYGYLFNKNEFPRILTLEWKPVLQRLQIWRPFTSFLNFGPFGLGYILTAQFVWTYMATLERLNHNRPFDFWILMLFGQLSMVIGYPLLKLSPRFLGHNLSTYLVYIWSRYHEGVEVNMFEMFNTKAELLPWFFLAQTFLLEGEPPVLDFLGIVFGHIYHHCKTVGILRAPDALVAWYHGDSEVAKRIREEYKVITSEFELV
ncbi:hypothetical protein FisN_5Lh173 [Fistulifera solaris]|uniref:Derlin n=1 Tax=Fistulifera solaris TaxID=1519565 RepID=A0A1Z5JIU9_FISSO|nr:hypothetical protein FisN_5Lh173 [Fistulifera solaris]|eukprot:GAX13924.1 hypothetical protein FisN_5Lh173 [Fistulifera solaris]